MFNSTEVKIVREGILIWFFVTANSQGISKEQQYYTKAINRMVSILDCIKLLHVYINSVFIFFYHIYVDEYDLLYFTYFFHLIVDSLYLFNNKIKVIIYSIVI